jgi:predicted alpha-1,2-mannosidase
MTTNGVEEAGEERVGGNLMFRVRTRGERSFFLRSVLCLLWTAFSLSACSGGGGQNLPGAQGARAVPYVDPFIGTEGAGNAIPGPCLPHAMVKLSPDTDAEPGSVDAYEYSDARIQGFSHTHLEGPGGSSNGYSHILLVPVTGELRTPGEGVASTFSHAEERAGPGTYAVRLLDYDILAELTSTARCGFHRYTFPQADDARILLDVGHTRGLSLGGQVKIVGDRCVRGHGIYSMHPLIALATQADPGTTARMQVYFHAEFDRPFSSFGTWRGSEKSPGSREVSGKDAGAFLEYRTERGETVQVKVGISYISEDQAEENLLREIPGWDFDGVRREAESLWEERLSRVRIDGGTDGQRTQFYTALYHSMLQPTDYSEYGRFWSGADGTGAVFPADRFRFFSDDWCVWDTFRTVHPLQALVEPELRSDIVQSYLHLYEQGGWLPKCTWQATGYSRVMIGNHAVSVILDAAVRGVRGFDTETAYAAMRKSALEDNENLLSGVACGYLNLGTPPDYLRIGYVPQECDSTQAVSMTLEYAYDDWCVARMAGILGKQEDHDFFLARSRNYVNHWNPEQGFMQPRFRDGEWLTPFDPDADIGFCEADAWKYTWFVPHDPAGLIRLLGGREAFLRKLDAFFDQGHYDASNEPDFHVPYLYVYAGAPHKTQQRVRALLETAFADAPSGLPGNDDAGATSAWYVFGALGLYPVCPGDPVYLIGSPLFPRSELRLKTEGGQGEPFTIEARNTSRENLYVQSATLDGRTLERAWIRYGEVAAGGRLVLEMGPQPSAWGSAPEDLPPSP